MRFVSFERQDGPASYGLLRGSGIVDLGSRLGAQAPTLKALLAAGLQEDARRYAGSPPDCGLADVRLLPVIPDPGLIACVGHNYEEHRLETQRDPTEHPSIFLRQPQSLQAAGEALLCPIESTQFDYEGELAIVIGKGGRRIAESDAWDHVAGVSCFNDASVRDWQHHTRQFTPGKNFVKTGAFGPCMVTLDELPPDRVLTVATRVNGQMVQQAGTDRMIFPVPRIVAYVSTFLPLAPGDVIATGTPGGVGAKRKPQLWLKAGDRVEVEIPGVGVLSNPVEREA